MANGSRWNLWVTVWLAGGCGWNLWVVLMGVIVGRYINFLILLIPLVSALFLQQHPYFLFIFKNVFRSFTLVLCTFCPLK